MRPASSTKDAVAGERDLLCKYPEYGLGGAARAAPLAQAARPTTLPDPALDLGDDVDVSRSFALLTETPSSSWLIIADLILLCSHFWVGVCWVGQICDTTVHLAAGNQGAARKYQCCSTTKSFFRRFCRCTRTTRRRHCSKCSSRRRRCTRQCGPTSPPRTFAFGHTHSQDVPV